VISKKKLFNNKVLIIIPAKNEYNNLIKLLNLLKKINIDVLIVDDNSTDKTLKLKKKFKRIKIIKNKHSSGYDKSIKIGLKFAKSKYNYVVTMDADLEHNPKYLLRFVGLLKKNYYMVIGERDRKNRYLENVFGFIIKKIYKINDLFCGYRAINLKKFHKKYFLNNYDLPSIILNYHLKYNKTCNIKINTPERQGISRFGNVLSGNKKIILQFLSIFFRKI